MNEKIFAALNSSEKLTSMLAKDKRGQCIYHGTSPDAGSYPILVYSMISDVPAVIADGEELERRITIRIHIITGDGVFSKIYREVVKIMISLGFVRIQTVEIIDGDDFVKVVDFGIGTGVDTNE